LNVYHVCGDLATANGGWTEAPITIYSMAYNEEMIWSCRYGDRDPGAHHLRGGARWLRDLAGIRGFQGRAGDDPAVGQPGRRVDHDAARADQQGAADAVRRPEPALCLPPRFLGDRAIYRPQTRHDDIEDERRLQRLLLDPTRAAKRTRRSVDGSSPESDDTVELAARYPASFAWV